MSRVILVPTIASNLCAPTSRSQLHVSIMPRKAPKAKPKPVLRRGAAAGPSSTDATSAPSPVAASPTSVATGSPAATTEPTIPRAPVVMPPKGRLDSLASPSTRGGPLLGPTGSKFKFKPKVVQRKSKEYVCLDLARAQWRCGWQLTADS